MTQNQFDAIVVGSGATGGIAALTLAELGVKVLVIEAGQQLTAKEAFGSEPLNTLNRVKRIICGENRIQAQHPGFWKSNPYLFVNEKDNQYITPKDSPFIWTQGSQVGGRSLTWGGITLRLSESDFKSKEEDGYGTSWPINYSDLEEHYTYIEKKLHIFGNKDGLNQLPDGHYKECLPFTESEKFFIDRVKQELNFPIIHSRGFGEHDKNIDGDWPISSSIGSTLKIALQTGKVDLLSNHIVESIILNNSQDKAEGLLVVDKKTSIRKKFKCSLIVLCASTLQSLKILLHSKNNSEGKSLIEPSGKLGSYLMDHISTCRFFTLPMIKGKINQNYKLTGAGSFFIPFGKELDRNTKIDFIRGYGIWGGIGRFEAPEIIKKKPQTKTGFLIGHGEVLAYKENSISLSNKVDKWGIPIPNINFKWRENEFKMVKHMNQTIEKCIRSAGGEVNTFDEIINIPFLKQISKKSFALQKSPPPPGYYIHEVGGAPMGADEETSVLDRWNRLWQCKNVLVVDGACWPTSAWQSPTLTMMAIARRACKAAAKNWSKQINH